MQCYMLACADCKGGAPLEVWPCKWGFLRYLLTICQVLEGAGRMGYWNPACVIAGWVWVPGDRGLGRVEFPAALEAGLWRFQC